MPLHLETDRLILRPFQDADVQLFSEYRSDPEVARYQSWETPYSLAQAAKFISALHTVQPGTPGEWLQIAIELKTTGLLVGDCAFCVLAKEPQQAEIGFTLARRHQRNGYAGEAVTALLEYLFSGLQLHRVRAICDVENLASARLLERIGMRLEGHFIESVWFKGRWSSEFWYAVLSTEWASKKNLNPYLHPL